MENLTPPPSPLQPKIPSEPKSPGQVDNSTLLYNPSNWAFYSFLFSPIVPAIFYNRNSKMLGKPEEGKKILMATAGSLILVFLILFFFDIGSGLGFVYSTAWIIFFAKKGKEEKPVHEERKKNFPNAPRPKEWPVVVTAIVILIALGFLAASIELLAKESYYSNTPSMRY